MGLPSGSAVKNPATQEPQETQVQTLGWKNSLEEGIATPPVFLPGEFLGQISWHATVHGATKSRT